MRFRFIEDRRADYPVTIMCEVLGVSPAGYYAWRSRPESRRSAANRHLIDDIKRVHRGACGRYGSPRIHAELKAQGRGASRGRIERLMRRHGVRAIMARPRWVRTTDSRHDFPIAPNLLERNFTATAPPICLGGLPQGDAVRRLPCLDEPQGRLLRQRADGELLSHAQN
jgi:putative transposase